MPPQILHAAPADIEGSPCGGGVVPADRGTACWRSGLRVPIHHHVINPIIFCPQHRYREGERRGCKAKGRERDAISGLRALEPARRRAKDARSGAKGERYHSGPAIPPRREAKTAARPGDRSFPPDMVRAPGEAVNGDGVS